MPKRSAEELIEHYERKIAKIRKRENTPNIQIEYTTDDESFISVTDEHEIVTIEGVEEAPPLPNNTVEIPFEEILPDVNITDATSVPEVITTLVEHGTSETSTPVVLDPELLAALGDSTDDSPEYGPDIHERLVKLWQPLLKKGMTKEAREKMYKDYLIPNNCRLLQAPKMNPEIVAAVTEARKTKDKRWVTNQQQIGSAITAINRAMETLMTSDDKALTLKHLSNSCRMLCDMHALFTKIRTRVVCPGLDKTTLNVINNTERDELIFGTNLSEKIKAAKTLERQGNQMKRSQTQTKNTQPSTSRPSYSENWQAPPRYPLARGRGGYRKPAPNTRRQYTQTSIVTPPAPPPLRGPRPAYQTSRPRASQQ